MIRKIKKYFAKREFEKLCPHVRCTLCNNFREEDNYKYGYCELAKELGLED